MILTQPRIVSEVEAYRPLLELLDDILVTSKFLADRYGYTEVHMANLRKNNRGWPYIKLKNRRRALPIERRHRCGESESRRSPYCRKCVPSVGTLH